MRFLFPSAPSGVEKTDRLRDHLHSCSFYVSSHCLSVHRVYSEENDRQDLGGRLLSVATRRLSS